MDKYEMNIKNEHITALAQKNLIKTASSNAKAMTAQGKRNECTSHSNNVQEASRRLREARDMAILAYNRKSWSRKLVYKLT